jgi:hypothetical protein
MWTRFQSKDIAGGDRPFTQHTEIKARAPFANNSGNQVRDLELVSLFETWDPGLADLQARRSDGHNVSQAKVFFRKFDTAFRRCQSKIFAHVPRRYGPAGKLRKPVQVHKEVSMNSFVGASVIVQVRLLVATKIDTAHKHTAFYGTLFNGGFVDVSFGLGCSGRPPTSTSRSPNIDRKH